MGFAAVCVRLQGRVAAAVGAAMGCPSTLQITGKWLSVGCPSACKIGVKINQLAVSKALASMVGLPSRRMASRIARDALATRPPWHPEPPSVRNFELFGN